MGTVIAWPLATLPTGSESGKWLECNGQAVNASLYPKLTVLMSYTPNYSGVFLRGYGSQNSYHYGTILHLSGNLGELQGDSIRNITGSIEMPEMYPDHSSGSSGAFYQYLYDTARTYRVNGSGYGAVTYFDTSRIVPTSNENRPVNKAVRYLIKAK
ncbi:MAG: hypothetical protein H6Q70_108 [Firmicutes bacterium]|nr:hypothetical protein [Bacillota bacterium]